MSLSVKDVVKPLLCLLRYLIEIMRSVLSVEVENCGSYSPVFHLQKGVPVAAVQEDVQRAVVAVAQGVKNI